MKRWLKESVQIVRRDVSKVQTDITVLVKDNSYCFQNHFQEGTEGKIKVVNKEDEERKSKKESSN